MSRNKSHQRWGGTQLPYFLFCDDDPDFITYRCNSLAVNYVQWYPPDLLEDNYTFTAPGEDLLHVSYSDAEMYVPKPIHRKSTMDYILSMLACTSSIDNATHGHLDPALKPPLSLTSTCSTDNEYTRRNSHILYVLSVLMTSPSFRWVKVQFVTWPPPILDMWFCERFIRLASHHSLSRPGQSKNTSASTSAAVTH